MKSLLATRPEAANPVFQLDVLNQARRQGESFPAFASKLREAGLFPLQATGISTLQLNVGKMCNQVCKHCHVDAGPDRKEIMTRATMQQCLAALRAAPGIQTVDLTGGAPEMNPDFRWLVEEVSALGRQLIVRCNLTIILANKKYYDLPDFFARHRVRVVSSLPHFTASRTDAQRGEGVFEKSIKALQLLNAVGYGQPGSDLALDLVFNPSGAFLPGNQAALEKEFKRRLASYGISFHNLLTITNLPVSRFLDYLLESGNYDAYMNQLVQGFNPAAAANVMCRSTLSVGWDGQLYDCDFNQMLDLPVGGAAVPRHIRDFELVALAGRAVVLNQHCYGCTAGAGSSCGGATAA